MERKVFDKTQEGSGAFVKYPLDLLQYRHHPKFKKGAETVYMLIVHYYNADRGCAYPSMALLAADCATTDSTIDTHIKSLEELELIKVVRRHSGNLYIPYVPLDREAFFAKYPQVEEKYNKRYKKYEDKKVQKAKYIMELNSTQDISIEEEEEYSDIEF